MASAGCARNRGAWGRYRGVLRLAYISRASRAYLHQVREPGHRETFDFQFFDTVRLEQLRETLTLTPTLTLALTLTLTPTLTLALTLTLTLNPNP